MSTRGLAEHVALELAPKPHRDRWQQPCCLLQAAWLVQRCLSAARGARHQAKAIALPLTPPKPPTLLSPASASLQLPSVWSSHTKKDPRGAWTRAPASLADCMGLHISDSLDTLTLLLCYIFVEAAHIAQVNLPMLISIKWKINGEAIVSDELDRTLTASRLAQI